MKMWSALVVFIIAIGLLVTGSSILTIALDSEGKIPLGNLITWAGMIALPLAVYWGSNSLRNPQGRWPLILSILLKIALVMALLWVPISFFLSGNFNFSFSNRPEFRGGQTAMKMFWAYSYGVAVLSILPILLLWLSLGIDRIIKKYHRITNATKQEE